MMDAGESLAAALPCEMARVRELKKEYESIGAAGRPAAYLMELTLQRADKAIMGGDVIEMIEVYKELSAITG